MEVKGLEADSGVIYHANCQRVQFVIFRVTEKVNVVTDVGIGNRNEFDGVFHLEDGYAVCQIVSIGITFN